MKTFVISWQQRRKLYFLTYGAASGAAGKAVFDARQMLEPDDKQAAQIGWEEIKGDEAPDAIRINVKPECLQDESTVELPDILFEALGELAQSSRWVYGDPDDVALLKLLELI